MKRLLVKRLGLPLTCLIVLSCMVIVQNVLYSKHVISDSELMKVLQALQKEQTQNKLLLIQTRNSSLSTAVSGKSHNISSEDSTEDVQTKAVRKWFDDRPGMNSSKMAASNHPLFPGYVIENPDLCKGEKVDVLVYLHTAVEHRESRRKIRETWSSPRTFADINLKLIFIVGRPGDDHIQHQIETEFSTYGDIIQGDFMDTFKNLTYKAITMLTWVNAHCSHVRYIMKVDDDMFVDTYRVISEFVPKLAPKKLAVACDVKTNMVIPRDSRIKWYVNEQLLPGRTTWPQFCSGYFAVLTGETIPALYEASFGITDFIPIDDAYLFGLLVERNVSVEFINIHDQISVNERPNPDKEISVNGKFEFVSFRVRSHDDHTKLWTLRSNKLSPWEKVHSSYFRTIKTSSHDRTMLFV